MPISRVMKVAFWGEGGNTHIQNAGEQFSWGGGGSTSTHTKEEGLWKKLLVFIHKGRLNFPRLEDDGVAPSILTVKIIHVGFPFLKKKSRPHALSMHTNARAVAGPGSAICIID